MRCKYVFLPALAVFWILPTSCSSHSFSFCVFHLVSPPGCCVLNVHTEFEILEVADKVHGNEILLKKAHH